MNSYKDPNKRRELIMKHYSYPHNKKDLNKDDVGIVSHYSTKCVDEIHLSVAIDGGVISDISFDGQGCAVHMSSADIMIDMVKEKTIEQASVILENYFNMINQKGDYDAEVLDKLMIFENVSTHLNRLHCAIMIYDVLIKFIGNK